MGRDSDDHVRGGLIVEHYRLDAGWRLIGALLLGSLVMTLGSLSIAGAQALTHLDQDRPVHARAFYPTRPSDGLMRAGQVHADGTPVVHRWAVYEALLGVLGLGLIFVGGGAAILRLNRVLSEERYLALRTDGAYLRLGDARELLKWEQVADVRWDAEREALVFELHDGEEWIRAERYAGVDGPTLAERVRRVRRKALFGLL